MGIRYEWADDSQLIMNIYLEFPWTWAEYNEMVGIIMPMLRDLGHPCATVVETSRIGSVPKDGNALQILMNVEKMMPDNVFASAVVGSPYGIRVFMNILMKLRPRARSIAIFTKTMEEAEEKIKARYRELYPDSVANE